MNLQYIDEIPGIPEGNLQTHTPAKYLMWQDILTGLFDANIAGLPLQAHYERLTETLLPAAERNGAYNLFFRYAYHVARVLAKKAEMGLRLTAAYRDGDRPALRRIAEEDLPELKARVQALHETHRAHWFELCKPLGWEMMDLRYGWLLTRIDTAILEVRQYLDGTLERLEELDEERLPYNGEEGLSLYPGGFGNMIAAGFLNYTTVN